MADVLAWLEALPLAVYLRQSTWLYPLVNTLHIVGVALLFGSVAVMDLRLIGVWRRTAAAPLLRVLAPVALAGFLLAAAAGILLFLVRATEYGVLWLFQLKMGLLVLAILNALWLSRTAGWRQLLAEEGAPVPATTRLAAALSLLLWLLVLTAGRAVGYA